MSVSLSHIKNRAVGWDITAKADAEKGERLVAARVEVNGVTVVNENLNSVSSWTRTLTQQGVFPGSNRVRATITNDQGDNASAEDSWE